MINVIIDEFTPCLKNSKTGELVRTEVIRIRRKSFLRKYNKNNGWYVNWASLLDDNEIYALVIEGSVDIQGLGRCYSGLRQAGPVYCLDVCESG